MLLVFTIFFLVIGVSLIIIHLDAKAAGNAYRAKCAELMYKTMVAKVFEELGVRRTLELMHEVEDEVEEGLGIKEN